MLGEGRDRVGAVLSRVMLVEIWSDVVCPWCYLGKKRFETAVESFAHRDEVEVVYRSFELDPTAERAATVPTVERWPASTA